MLSPGETHHDIISGIFNDRISKHPLIFTGDFNLPDIEWTNGEGQVKQNSNRRFFHQQAVNLFNSSSLVQLVQGPTHRRGNTLDLFLSRRFFLIFSSLSEICSQGSLIMI